MRSSGACAVGRCARARIAPTPLASADLDKQAGRLLARIGGEFAGGEKHLRLRAGEECRTHRQINSFADFSGAQVSRAARGKIGAVDARRASQALTQVGVAPDVGAANA